MIYHIKNNTYCLQSALIFLEKMLQKYKTDCLIVGCTEIHLINKYFLSQNHPKRHLFLDPLITIAQKESLRTNNYVVKSLK